MFQSCIKKMCLGFLNCVPSSYVLLFHHVTETPVVKRSGCLLNTDQFTDLIMVGKNFRSLSEIIAKPSIGGFGITFDDGLLDLYTVAYPFLKRRGIPFAAFVVTDYLGKPGYINENQLIEMSNDPLVTIGSHGITHKNLNALSFDEKKNEILMSKKILETIIHKNISYFAYSHGQYDRDVLSVAKAYDAAFSVASRPLNIFTLGNMYTIPRYNIDSNNVELQTKFFMNISKRY